MIAAVLIILIALWFFGYIQISGIPLFPDIQLFAINGHPVTLFNLLVLAVIGWAIGILPTPLRQIAAVILVIWILATLGIIGIAGLPSILVLAIIIGLVLALIGVV